MSEPPDNAGPSRGPEPSLIDRDDLKQRIREAVRPAIREHADELGLTYEAYLDRYFPK